MALFSRKNIKSNPFGLTKDDLKGDIGDFPIGVVVRMIEEQELQGNERNVEVFQDNRVMDRHFGGFDWDKTEQGRFFWLEVINNKNWCSFFEKYPDYERYNLS